MKYKLITDSCCDLPADVKKELGVVTVPLTMRLGNREFVDDDHLDLPAFMSEMGTCTEKIGSASPSPALYQAAFNGSDISFAVTLSSKLSGSYDSAEMGKKFALESGEADVHIFDSKSASAGQTLVTLKLRH